MPAATEAERAARADAAARRAASDARAAPTATSSCSRIRIARCWDRAQIDEGLLRVEAALQSAAAPGPYAIQAAIAALHARARVAGETDWRQIEALYALLLQRAPSAVVELNHAVAVAMVEGPERGLLLADAIDARGELRGYHLLHAVRADLLRRLGRATEAAAAYETALELVSLEPERRFLQRRLIELRSLDSSPTPAES